MKKNVFQSFYDSAVSRFVFALLMLALTSAVVSAQTTTFAQFVERNGTNDFVFTNNGTSANFNAISGGSPVWFFFQQINNLDPSLQGAQMARVFVTTTTTTPAVINGANLNQPLNQTVTVQVIRETPAPPGVGTGTRTNLLTAVFTPSGSTPSINGTTGGNSATLSATTPDHTVTFTSDFLGFALTTQRNLAFSFSSVTNFNLGAGNFLNSFSAAATGTFASNPPPIYSVPSNAGAEVAGVLRSSNGTGARRATMMMTEADGTVHYTTTNNFGHFRFPAVPSGQSVIISSVGKRFHFDSVFVDLTDSVLDLTITTEQ